MNKELSCIRWDTEDPYTKSKNRLLSGRFGGAEAMFGCKFVGTLCYFTFGVVWGRLSGAD